MHPFREPSFHRKEVLERVSGDSELSEEQKHKRGLAKRKGMWMADTVYRSENMSFLLAKSYLIEWIRGHLEVGSKLGVVLIFSLNMVCVIQESSYLPSSGWPLPSHLLSLTVM